MTLSPGTRLGPYEIVSPIGAGGMGEVYRGRDARLDRDVAIKVLPQSVAASPEALDRFELEAKSVAALSHPNILAIHDFGVDNGVAYAVMELLEGETLRDRLESGPISQKQAVDYALQAASGLSAAHEKGVVHRDLKPDNFFITRDGHVKILDFGLAKRVGPVSPNEQSSAPTISDRTEPGTVLGTLGYMSPEQVRGLAVDHRSDIFSFGSVLYEMLSGKKAFKRATPADTVSAILKEDPAELSKPGSDTSALDRVVWHCLEKDRENRFQSARDIAFALSEASSPTGVIRPESLRPRTGGKRAIAAVAASVALVLAAAALVLLLRKSHGGASSGSVKRVAVLPFENLGAPGDDYFVDGISDEIRGKLTSLPGLEIIARASSRSYKKTTKTPKQIGEELTVSYLLTATVRFQDSGGVRRVLVSPELVDVTGSGAATSKWEQPFDASVTDVFQVQTEIATRVAGVLGVVLGADDQKRLTEKPTRQLAAYEAFLRGEEAGNSLGVNDPPSLRAALGFYEQAVALDPEFALAWAQASRAASYLYYLSVPTPALAERARQGAEKAIALRPRRPEGYVASGIYYLEVSRDLRRALEEYDRGRQVAPANAELFRVTAGVERSLGRWDAAVENYRRAVRLDPLSIRNLWSLGSSLSRLHHYSEAREALDRGLSLAPANLSLLENKAMTFLQEGNLDAARGVLHAAPLSVTPAALAAYVANNYDMGWLLDPEQRRLLLRLAPAAFDDNRGAWGICLAEAAAAEADPAAVRRFAEEAKKSFVEQLRAAPDDPEIHVQLALALAYLGDREGAIREGERAVSILPISKDQGAGPFLLHELVKACIIVGDPEKALDNLERLLRIPYYLSPGWLKIDPSFDPLRRNPRFQKLVSRWR